MKFRHLFVVRTIAALGLGYVACGGVPAREPSDAASGGSDFGGMHAMGGAAGGAAPHGGAGGRRPLPEPPITDIAGWGGDGGTGGAKPNCEGGLIVRTYETLSPGSYEVIVLPDKHVAWLTRSGTIALRDASLVAKGGSLIAAAELTADTLGLTGGRISAVEQYGDGLIAVLQNGSLIKFVAWQLDGTVTELMVPQSLASLDIAVADPKAGIAFVDRNYRIFIWSGAEDNSTISEPIGAPAQARRPLAFDGPDLLVRLEESRGDFGSGGEAGMYSGWSARLERWNAQGQRIASYEAVGNPNVATPVEGGWLIGETNSFFGTYQAALEWLAPGAQQLQVLTSVPVHSFNDGVDGTFGVVVNGRDVFLTNGGAGLLYGKWQGNSVQLAPLGEEVKFAFSGLYALGDLLVSVDDQWRLVIASRCEQ